MSGLGRAVGILWEICGEAGEQVRGDFVLTNLERAAIGVPANPPGVVPSGDAHVRVPELTAHISELDASREELGRVVLRHVSEALEEHQGRRTGLGAPDLFAQVDMCTRSARHSDSDSKTFGERA